MAQTAGSHLFNADASWQCAICGGLSGIKIYFSPNNFGFALALIIPPVFCNYPSVILEMDSGPSRGCTFNIRNVTPLKEKNKRDP